MFTLRLPAPDRLLFACALLALGLTPVPGRAHDIPAELPRYDLDIKIEVGQQRVVVRQRVQWTNSQQQPTDKLVFNVASNYTIDTKQIGLLAKTLEILRLAPSEVFDFGDSPFQLHRATFVNGPTPAGPPAKVVQLAHHFQEDNKTALDIQLPYPVSPGQSVTLDLEFTLRLPQKQGRWGQWNGVTSLAQWLPVVAIFDGKGWQPAPFIPWHQPFFNDAGIYNVSITLPCDQVLGCTGSVLHEHDLGGGWRQVRIMPTCARDFSLCCCGRYHEYTGQAGNVRVRVLALPEHEFYGKEMVRIACEAIPIYERWFGPYPYPQLTIVDAPFGWNGNECGGLIMIDSRVCGFPTIAKNFVDHLLTHEICHQWFYNVVGTNGYAETWMDEGLATYFSNKVMDQKLGVNNGLMTYPGGLKWLPQIRREDYRHTGMWGTIRRGEATAPVQPMPGFGHLVTLMSMAYDRGGKVVGMIEQRLGEAAFLDFMRLIYGKYHFRVLLVADFQRELEAYTGRSWEEFFHNWLYGTGMVDWAVEKVELEQVARPRPNVLQKVGGFLKALHRENAANQQPYRVVVYVKQKGTCDEPTYVGFHLNGSDDCQVRVPVVALPGLQLKSDQTCVEGGADKVVRVEVVLPSRPTQITIDPDHILLDANPFNNTWKPRVRVRTTPLLTMIDEADLTNSYDRWNVNVGPWLYGSSFNDPWYTRSALGGLRASMYVTQNFYVGGFIAYRTDDRNVVVGTDGLVDHWPLPNTQVGFHVERSVATFDNGRPDASRGVLFGRYVMMYSDSLYLPPFNYVEAFVGSQNRMIQDPRHPAPHLTDYDHQTFAGLHYHLYYLTPYWDPEGGIALDATYQAGLPICSATRTTNQVTGQFSFVKTMPEWLAWTRDVPGLGWFMDTRLAMRAYGAAALPNDAPLFPLGGGTLLRGFDLRERQGNLAWVGSAEWRIPLYKGVECEFCDRVGNLKHLYGAAFYDVGNAYLGGHQLGTVAHSFGGGLRFDVAWLGLIERTMLRVDAAKVINAGSPWQVWFGIMLPF